MKLSLIITILLMAAFKSYSQEFWAIANEPCPVLNTSDFNSVFGGADGMTLKTDKEGLIRELEFIALPGTVFELLGEYDYGTHKIFHCTCDEYQYNVDLFIDSRFVEVANSPPPRQPRILPSKENIYAQLDKAVGKRYCWGGNYISGIKKLIEFYKPSLPLSEKQIDEWNLVGCDCSGLMYEATNGNTPRNTSKLINFGEPIEIAGLTAEQIVSKLEPLDMLVWDGHVIYVYDKTTAIQSSLSRGGVIKTDLVTELTSLMETRKPVNDFESSKGKRFVIRRWYSEK